VPEPFDISSIELPEDSEVHALLQVCPDEEGIRYTNDEFLVHGQDTAMDIFLILRGNCLVEQPDAPRERTPGSELAVIQAEPDSPVFVGEMAYLGGGYRTAAVRSVMATHVIRLQPHHLDTIMEELPGMTRILCRQFAQRLGEANTFIKTFQELSAMEASQRFLKTGDVLVNAGDAADRLYQVIDGCVAESDGGDTVIQHGDGPSTFVHAAEFFSEGKHPYGVTARTSSIVLGLERSSVEAIIRNFPDLALELLRSQNTK